ncbi:RhuM family protein [Corynebacterium diphtheriae]|uniref:DNA-binding protein n=1 Tax=Corynebacterium diphtheriae TaxID=1717 RepID=A0A811FZ21_CORDP|nr:RhuM family protein [Corynebacterium diphtheriae]CAB0585122.1 DNA-binding protein [Corynebacterium diphtheriae]
MRSRISERQFFRKICDVIAATSADYEEIKSYKEVKNFFAGIQNRLHFATHGNTAAELICLRADHTKPNAGLTNWTGEQPPKGDMSIAKNFLNYAEDQAERKKTLLLDDWMKKTDAWLVFNERHVLHGFGKRSHKQAIAKAQAEWDAYQLRFDAEVNTMDMKAVEAEVKALNRGDHSID